MSYIQIVQPNLGVVGKPGYCLAYVENVFKTSHLYANASEGWRNAKYKHTGQPPNNVIVPIWFSFKDPDWHVCIWSKGIIYTTTAQGMKQFGSIQALLNFMNNGTVNEEMVYLGWSEDLAGVRLVKGVTMPTVPPQNAVNLTIARILAYSILGRNGVTPSVMTPTSKPALVNALNGQCDADLQKNHVGKLLSAGYIATLYNSPEAQAFRKALPAVGLPDTITVEGLNYKKES